MLDDPNGPVERAREAEDAGELCQDEGCPHYGTPHVCISRVESQPWRGITVREEQLAVALHNLLKALDTVGQKSVLLPPFIEVVKCHLPAFILAEQIIEAVGLGEEHTRPMVNFAHDLMDSIKQEHAEHDGAVYCEVCALWYDKEDPCKLH